MEKKQLEMDARDARPKKIPSRGSDHLAFITGQSQSLSEPDPPSHPLSDVGSLTDEGDENEANEPISSTEVESNTPKAPVAETANNVFFRAMSNRVLKEIINTISASENSRMMCSVMIALFVVMCGFSHKFKPLALVAVADLTIILGRVLGNGAGEIIIGLRDVGSWDNGKGAGETRIIWRDVGVWTVCGAFLLMEVAYAVIIDCSLCALITICSFALLSS